LCSMPGGQEDEPPTARGFGLQPDEDSRINPTCAGARRPIPQAPIQAA
jgi:hypothetical protein